jgi:hypothetical protein
VVDVAHHVAQAMADYENERRWELESGSQSTGVEPYEYSTEDFEEIATFVAQRLSGVALDDELLANLDARAERSHTDRAGYLRWILTGKPPKTEETKPPVTYDSDRAHDLR